MIDFSDPEAPQKRMDELHQKREEILSRSTPMREEKDKLFNAARAEDARRSAEIAEVEKDLAAIDYERGFLARGMGGRSLSQPSPEDVPKEG